MANITTRSALTLWAFLLGATLSAAPAFAQATDPLTNLPQVEPQDPTEPAPVSRTYPFLDAELALELGFDGVPRSDDPDNEITDVYGEAALAVTLGLTPIFSVNLGLTAERVLDLDAGEDGFFDDIGVYVDTLNLQADIGDLTLYGGKFGPTFGKAWDITPGVYGTDFAEDYELSEQLGFGAAYRIETASAGVYTLGANLFTIDTSFLSDSAFTSRGRLGRDDGGAGNTGKLDSFSFTLDGEELPSMDGFSFNLGYRHLAEGSDSVDPENGYVAGVAQEFELNGGTTFGITAEVAYFDSFGGSGSDATYVTGGAFVQRGPWHGELSGTLRHASVEDGDDLDDTLIQVSGGYEFENELDLSAGVAFVQEEEVDSTVVGLRLTKAFTYSSDK